MKTAQSITLGPYFTATDLDHTRCDTVVPLNLAIEWSTSEHAARVELFRRHIPYAPDRLRFEHILFRHQDFPGEMECLEHQTVERHEGLFLPVDALIGSLYQYSNVTRCIFTVLDDLASAVPIRNTITTPLAVTGLLTSEAESQGFKLNAVFGEPGHIHAQIVWEPRARSTWFHTCIISLDEVQRLGTEVRSESGVSQILTQKLLRCSGNGLSEIFSQKGREFLAIRNR